MGKEETNKPETEKTAKEKGVIHGKISTRVNPKRESPQRFGKSSERYGEFPEVNKRYADTHNGQIAI